MEKKLPYVSGDKVHGYHAWAWGPEDLMVAMQLVYERLAEVLEKLEEKS